MDEVFRWYTRKELEEMYQAAQLSDLIPTGMSFEEYIMGFLSDMN